MKFLLKIFLCFFSDFARFATMIIISLRDSTRYRHSHVKTTRSDMSSRPRQSRHRFVGGRQRATARKRWYLAKHDDTVVVNATPPVSLRRTQVSQTAATIPLPQSGPSSSLSSSSFLSHSRLARSRFRTRAGRRKRREGAKTLLDTERPRASRRPEEQ